MKKAITLILCACLALSLGISACADYTAEDLVKELQEMEHTFDYYAVELEDDIIYMKIAMDGTTAQALKLKQKENFDEWKEITDELDEVSEMLQERADECDGELLTCVMLLNDQNDENVLYSVTNGICLYDFVTGYDIEDELAADAE